MTASVRMLEAENRLLRERDERHRLMLRAVRATQWDCDLVSGRVVVQIGDDEPIERSIEVWKSNIHPDDRARVAEAFDRMLSGEKADFAEHYRFRSPDGSYVSAYDRGYAVAGPDGTPVRAVGGATDLTDLHEVRHRLEQAQSELIHVSRLSAMGAMASTLAHELNQPLAAISNYVHAAGRLLNGELADRDRLGEALVAAEENATRAGDIVRRLRDLVAKGRIERRPEPVAALIRDACAIALLDAPALGIRHHVNVAADVGEAMADRVQIQQVIVNLVRNAVDAVKGIEHREIGVEARRSGPTVEICVWDSGAGVAAELLPKLFSPFATTKPDGLGIGLSISRTIVEAHGGGIWFAERPGCGSRFCFTVPHAPAAVAQSSSE